jgi:hypothetical protein
MKMSKKVLITVICFLLVACCLPAFADEGYFSDPMTIGVGARALGMGKAYVGVAEDGDAVFTNPAGIARDTNPKLSSMYTSLMGDVSYMVIGGVYPFQDKSAIGAGIVRASMADIPLTDEFGSSEGTGSWGNTVAFVSYGTYLNRLPFFLNLDKDILIGCSLKYLNVGGSGSSSVEAGNGSGYNIDLGALYPVNDYITLGVAWQNALTGAKLTKSSGSSDSLLSTLKLGTRVAILGKEGTAYLTHNTRKLYWMLDYDHQLNGNSSGIVHTGVEFWPTSNLALRGGVDNGDLTAGVGLRFSGVEFNYAYHPYSGISENNTHYFSIGYLGESRKRELRVKIDSPADKSVIYEDHAKVSGKVEVTPGDEDQAPAGPISLKINGINAPISADGSFQIEAPVDTYGKKLLQIEVSDTAGDTAVAEARLVRLTSFADVPDGYWAKMPIENNATVGLVEGYPDKTFRPENALTRAELATLLVRAKGIKVPDTQARQIFKDVKKDFWAAKYIEIAQREGLVQGYPDKTFRPNNKINKVEGIVVLARFDEMKLAAVYEKPYWDIETNHWAAKYIQAAKDSGMLKFIERNRLQPKDNLARAEAVEMLGKTSLAGGKIKDLYTWEKGFKREFGPEQRPTIKASLDY